ncbi:MAG: hypothetical protein PHO08_09475 [Methylococcales bacterium]|nr:hypothetical protein [Methylococcales bacterium]
MIINLSILFSRSMMKKPLILFFLFFIIACTALSPKNSDDLCATFRENEEWYDDAKQSSDKWGVPISVQMAIMHQESHFVADAQPPRTWLLGIIPWFRPSSAYGYAQAQDGTWDDYLDKAGSWGADRDDFADAADFIGWYSNLSNSKLGIAKGDAKNLYLAYHEGHGGYQHKSYLKKAWLKRAADKVAYRARLFQRQLSACKMN